MISIILCFSGRLFALMAAMFVRVFAFEYIICHNLTLLM